MSSLVLKSLLLLSAGFPAADPAPAYRAEFVFPMRSEHNHAPGIVEFPNGDLLASWYRGSGERKSDDVAVWGARLKHGVDNWSTDFVMADFPQFPDCNTCMMIDRHGKLWLFWPIILANTWESAITQFKVSSDFTGEGCPTWEREGAIYLKPDDFKEQALKHLEDEISKGSPVQQAYFKAKG